MLGENRTNRTAVLHDFIHRPPSPIVPSSLPQHMAWNSVLIDMLSGASNTFVNLKCLKYSLRHLTAFAYGCGYADVRVLWL